MQWIEAMTHDWHMQIRAWKALLETTNTPHDIAHCVTRIKVLEKRIFEAPYIDEKRRYRREAAEDMWRKMAEYNRNREDEN